MKPRIFIGSSSEGLKVAYALQTNLENDGEVTVWTQDVFKPSEFILESLLKQLKKADVGIFVFSPDDTINIRGVEQTTVRDNVIFEVGMYIGGLGRERSFIVAPKGGNPRLPSDLLGVTVLNYDGRRPDEELEAALGPASNKIRIGLKEIAPTIHALPSELFASLIERRDMLSATQRTLLEKIEKRAPISKSDIASLFPDISRSELHYRIEQLRLLQFIVAQNKNSSNEENIIVDIHPLYAYIKKGAHNLRTS